MKHVIVAVKGLVWLFAVMVATGCSDRGNPPQSSQAGRADEALRRLESRGVDERDVVRIRKDALRNRLWVLTLDNVRVFDIASKRTTLIRHIALPSGSVAPFDVACMPDLALDRSGSGFVTSNLQPKLLRIDPDSFEIKMVEIRLQGKEQWDTGFGTLAFAGDGTLYALTSLVGSLWKIDTEKASATLIHLNDPPLIECAFTARFLKDFESAPKPWMRPSSHEG